jgi:CBS-domain-containing membrane protein
MMMTKVPDLVWGPLAGGILILAVGLIALAAGQVWLFPSLGPTVYLQVVTPKQPSAKIYAVLVGHTIGVAVAAIAMAVTGAAQTLPMSSGALSPERVWASVLAIALLIFGEKLAKAGHPPAAATALLITLGGLGTTPKDLLAIAAGVVIVAGLGEILRRLRAATPDERA